VQLYGDSRIEDLALPFFCVSSSLGRAEVVVHQEGPVWRAVKASGSIPGVGPPVVKGDDLLVDGGVLDNLPIEVGRRLFPGTVIGVSVQPGVDRGPFAPYDDTLGPLASLWRRLGPGPKPPSIVGILLRAAYLGTSARLDRLRREADVFLEPPVASFRPLDPRPFEHIVQVGYEHARQRLADPVVRHVLGL
jgi:NTE family protein